VVTVATTDPVRSGAAPEPDWRVIDRLVDASGATSFTLRSSGREALRVTCPLPGDFNVANTALAVVMLVEAGVEPHVAAHGLGSSDGVPGRMERVGTVAPGLPLAVVDYAHTADAIEAAATALRPATAGRLLVVLGAGGDRDKGKRRAMGAAAARYSDVVVVTDDNPRSEDPAQIRAAVLEGARHEAESTGAHVLDVADRRAAIRAAVELARAGDTVLVAGKGHEQGQEIAGTVHPFDDRQVLGEALAARAAQGEEPA
jgi:UDP-N-acetylmuramoyl-L-alanyl-D-glutamate--2,6-diaminopimelate ligase